MKFKFLLTLFVLCTSFIAKAQDTLYRTNGEKMIIQVTEVSASEIKYKKGDNGSGPVYVIKTAEVRKVVYADGHSDVFVAPKSQSQRPASSSSSRAPSTRNMLPDSNGFKRKHLIGLNVTDLLPGIISLSYEVNVFKDNVSLRFPLSFGLSGLSGLQPDNIGYPDFYYYNRNKVFSSGFDLRYYPSGQNFSSYFVGLTWEYGQVNYTRPIFGPFPQPGAGELTRTWFSSVGVVNGVLIQPSQNLNVSLFCSLGTQVTGLDDVSGYRAMLRGGIVLGWRYGNGSTENARKPREGVIRVSE
ncbi:MAG: hypothetical protein IM638_07465 [Bacteroidetes bacterium]|nr:hypothetical protein [Bacteroidota bacterium]